MFKDKLAQALLDGKVVIKGVNEENTQALSESEQLDELSSKTLTKYRSAAQKDSEWHSDADKLGRLHSEHLKNVNTTYHLKKAAGYLNNVGLSSHSEKLKNDSIPYEKAAKKYELKIQNRKKGIELANNKLTGQAKVNAKESYELDEAEQLDELSKKTLSNYIVKSAVDKENQRDKWKAANTKRFKTLNPRNAVKDELESESDFEERKVRLAKRISNAKKDADIATKKDANRSKGISLAARKLIKKTDSQD